MNALAAIDWRRPWLAPFGIGEACARSVTASGVIAGPGPSVAEALQSLGQPAVRFVPQSALPPGQAYEQFIFDTASVPTRDNLHDFFNGLCWVTFPRTKEKLNQLQAAQIAVGGVQALRGAVRDALTVLDENAAFLMAPQPLWDALLARDWQALFVRHRLLWREAQLVIFGHALLEKLVFPRKAVTAHVYLAPAALTTVAKIDALDSWVAASLTAEKLATKPFTPLPVLGVPGWWLDNKNLSFYDDSDVFRPIQTTTNRPVPPKALSNPLI